MLTAPGDLGLARAYVSGDLALHGVHPGDPYPVMQLLHEPHLVPPARAGRGGPAGPRTGAGQPQAAAAPAPGAPAPLASGRGGAAALADPRRRGDPPPLRRLQRLLRATCSVPRWPTPARSTRTRTPPWRRRRRRSSTWSAASSASSPGSGCSTSGCGWGGMVRHAAREYGVRALGVTLSASRPTGAARPIERDGLGDRAEVRHSDYRDVLEAGFDAISSIGLTEHIGVAPVPGVLRLPARPPAPRGPAAQPLHHPPAQPAARRPGTSSTATSSPTGSSPAPARSSPRPRTPGSRSCTRRTCGATTR